VQDYDAMVSLVEEMDRVSDGRLTGSVTIQYWYSFALNRYGMWVFACGLYTFAVSWLVLLL